MPAGGADPPREEYCSSSLTCRRRLYDLLCNAKTRYAMPLLYNTPMCLPLPQLYSAFRCGAIPCLAIAQQYVTLPLLFALPLPSLCLTKQSQSVTSLTSALPLPCPALLSYTQPLLFCRSRYHVLPAFYYHRPAAPAERTIRVKLRAFVLPVHLAVFPAPHLKERMTFRALQQPHPGRYLRLFWHFITVAETSLPQHGHFASYSQA